MTKRSEANDELRLAHRAANGDGVALSTLYHRHADLLFAFIYHRMGGRRPDAEDVFQETWMAAIRSLPTFRGENRFFYWLCGIGRNKIADSGAGQSGEFGKRGSPASRVSLLELIDEGPLPEDIIDRIETRTMLVNAMASLPDDYRAALIGRYAEGLSVPEVGRRIGRGYKATESLLARARATLRERLRSIEGGEQDGRG